jgi:hypothetical protein
MDTQERRTQEHEPFSISAFHVLKDSSSGNLCLGDLINVRAYDLYERSGRVQNREIANWTQAEREIRHHLGI